ncbi:hypothetical protein [Rubellimicrobium arenae]|uniref:hypothetical protein n=1 Tax=Rubellimicrobium arenae TaxID=2817372 RepID=UPI001B304C34|nr:hypothetical protein [Rubellimicrobium arenae]
MTIPCFTFEGSCADARRTYAAIFRPRPQAGRPCPASAFPNPLVYASVHTARGWHAVPDPCRADPGAGTAMAVTLSDPGEGQRVFDALSHGGRVETPYGATDWSPGFGRVTDRWGTRWMVDAIAAPRGGA